MKIYMVVKNESDGYTFGYDDPLMAFANPDSADYVSDSLNEKTNTTDYGVKIFSVTDTDSNDDINTLDLLVKQLLNNS